ncbi:F-type H+-transporting ATPase subunit g [Clonorchis sinensis]|uniref:F-type H+-transporting ATPase subunit g n=1 Tax=Clonorchis sinensis TaxID=79923 RepID=G7YJM7_CLOSI|nr:F-type H+-transporting ATPase subunit g [Clonorchis sinensis]
MESTVAKLISFASSRPALSKFMTYARVEMRPPTLSDIGPAVAEATQLINAAKSGRWKEVTVKVRLSCVSHLSSGWAA